MIAKQEKIEFIESRWKIFGKELPRKGEIFVGRRNNEVYNTLFLCIGGSEVTYLADSCTHLHNAFDWFTHWLYVGEKEI